MQTHQVLFLLLSLLWTTAVIAEEAPMGRIELTESERSCLQGKMGRPSQGQRPDMTKMKKAFESCGIEAPSSRLGEAPGQASSQRSAKIESSVSKDSNKAQDLVKELKSLKSSDDSYVRAEGYIPKKCADNISIEMSCKDLDNVVNFTFLEIKDGGIQCLRQHKEDCSDKNSTKCSSLGELSQKSANNFTTRLNVTQTKIKGCKSIEIATVKVGFLVQQKEKKESVAEQTEGSFCPTCQASSGNHSAEKLKSQASEIEEKAKEKMGSPPDQAMLDRQKKSKERMLKKIRSMPCPRPGEDSDEDPKEMMSKMGGGFPGGPENGDGPSMAKMDPSIMDDVQEAMDKKMEKCQKEGRRQMGGAGGPNMMGQTGGAGGRQGGSMGSNLMPAMQGGGMNMGFGQSMGGGQSLNPMMNSMMMSGGYSSASSFMSSQRSPMLGGYGPSSYGGGYFDQYLQRMMGSRNFMSPNPNRQLSLSNPYSMGSFGGQSFRPMIYTGTGMYGY